MTVPGTPGEPGRRGVSGRPGASGRPAGVRAAGEPGALGTVHVVLPGGVDDPASPSGGNRYDRAVCDRLARRTDLHEIALPGSWPRPGPATEKALGAALTDLPDDATVLLDGLVACGVPEILEPQAARLRLVVLVHLPLGDETGLTPADAADLAARERRVVHAAAGVIATSAAAARRVATLHDLPATRITVAPPGVDPAPLTRQSDTGDRLLCVAAVTPRKGHDVLIEALTRLDGLSWTCTCVGALDRAGFLPAGHPPGLTFTGPRTGAGLDAAYAAADLLVLPSRAETYGMVVTEALARGIPVLATRVDGVPEALGEAPGGAVPGELVPPGDPDALAAALRRWLTDPELRRRRRAAALARRAGLRGWDDTAGLVAGALQEVSR